MPNQNRGRMADKKHYVKLEKIDVEIASKSVNVFCIKCGGFD